MSNRLLVDNIIENAKNWASVPTNQDRFSDALLVQMLQDIVDTDLFPMVLASQGNYNEIVVEVSSDSEGIIDIPDRAYLSNISLLKVKDTDSFLNEISENTKDSGFNSYFFRGSEIHTDIKNETFELTYTLRPFELILSTDAPKVVSFNSSTRVVEVDKTQYSTDMDIIKSNGYSRALNQGRTSTVTATQFVLAGTSVPVAGDYITSAEQSPILPLPYELASLAARMLTSRIMLDIPDMDGYESSKKIEEQMKNNLEKMLEPRGRKSSVIVNRPFVRRNTRYRRGV